MKIFGIDPGSERTGYGCIESDGRRHRLVVSGAICAPSRASFPERLLAIYEGLRGLLDECRPDCVAIEDVFHARNVRSALKLGHARGVALLAATAAGVPVVAYTPAEVKRAVVGYGRAEKRQVQRMVCLLLGLKTVPTPLDASDALAIAVCHLNRAEPANGSARRVAVAVASAAGLPRSWRALRPDQLAAAKRPH